MIENLESLLSEGATINLTINKLDDGRYCAIVIIKNDKEKKQTGPLIIKGTASEVEDAMTEKLLDSKRKVLEFLELNSDAFDKSIEPEVKKSSVSKPATKKETVALKKNLTASEKLDAQLDDIMKIVQESDVRSDVYAQWKVLSALGKNNKANARIPEMLKEVNVKLLELSDREDEGLFKEEKPAPAAVKEAQDVDDGMSDDPDDPDTAADPDGESEEKFEMEETEQEPEGTDPDEGGGIWEE